jgi:hypothetical protein
MRYSSYEYYQEARYVCRIQKLLHDIIREIREANENAAESTAVDSELGVSGAEQEMERLTFRDFLRKEYVKAGGSRNPIRSTTILEGSWTPRGSDENALKDDSEIQEEESKSERNRHIQELVSYFHRQNFVWKPPDAVQSREYLKKFSISWLLTAYRKLTDYFENNAGSWPDDEQDSSTAEVVDNDAPAPGNSNSSHGEEPMVRRIVCDRSEFF